MRSVYLFYYIILYPLARLLLPCTAYGKDNIPAGPLVICANHTSLMDPVLVGYAFGRKCQLFFMAKAELFKVPILGAFLRSLGVFPINREETDISSIRTAIKHLKNGQQIMMFPEGTRVGDNDTVPPKSGAVRIAAKMKAPILPIYITPGKKIFRASKIVIGAPYTIEAPADKNYLTLSEQLMEKIQALEPKH